MKLADMIDEGASTKLKFVLEEENINLFTWFYIWEGFTDPRMKELCGSSLSPSALEFKDDYGKWAVDLDNWFSLGKGILKALNEKKFDTAKAVEISRKIGDKTLHLCDDILNTRLGDKPEEELHGFITELYSLSKELCRYGFPAVASDFYHFTLSNELDAITKKRISEKKLSKKSQEYVSILTTPTRDLILKQENIELFEIAAEIKRTVKEKFGSIGDLEKLIVGKYPALNARLQKHVGRYFWMNYGYQGAVWGMQEFLKEIFEAMDIFSDIDSEIIKLKSAGKNLEGMQKSYIAELGLDKREIDLFRAAQDLMFLKAYRIDVRSKANYTFDRIFAELAKRHGVSLQEIRYMTLEEVSKFIETGRADSKTLKERRKHSVCVQKGEKIDIYIGKEADSILEDMVEEEEIKEVKEIRGQVACLGRVKGPVKIVIRLADISKVVPGDILVSIGTTPDYVPAMAKAVAFVTDTGGITCHAAIVAREMNKPCIVGTKIGTKILKDGDLIEVDAVHGIVRKLEGL
jgi:phosphoenolpyruvate synthase/pyruvate phosphate dikinase